MPPEKPLALRILLVRHARPLVDAGRPSHEWDLEDGASEDIVSLSPYLRRFNVDGIITSPERKAVSTAGIIASVLRLPVVVEPALREQGNEGVPWVGGEHLFREAVAHHFARPCEVVLGNESSDDAVKRFGAGVERARAWHRFPLLVGHGRVMSGFIARIAGMQPMEVWTDLRMPDALIVDIENKTWRRIGEKEIQ